MIGYPGRVSRVAVSVALVLLMATAASAQRGFGRFISVPLVDLASLDQVQNDMQLPEEVRKKISETHEQYRNSRRDLFRQGFGEETRQKMQQLGRDASDTVLGLLDEQQRERLLGISIQVNGARALDDPHITEALQLTEQQDAALAEARAANFEAVDNARYDFSHLEGDERDAKFAEVADANDGRLLAVLTDAQRQQFEAMKGEPLEVDLSPLRRRGRRDQ